MKEKHIRARIDQCLRNAELSSCPRRKFGALLLDPSTNSIVSDGYNGPRKGEVGSLCSWKYRGAFCEREGLQHTEIDLPLEDDPVRGPSVARVRLGTEGPPLSAFLPRDLANERALEIYQRYPPIESGTHMEKGCHHAELNCLANAAQNGRATRGTWLFITGEPCMMCAKFLHHAGITKVFIVKGGYAGGDLGVQYLQASDIAVVYVDGPQDPRNKS